MIPQAVTEQQLTEIEAFFNADKTMSLEETCQWIDWAALHSGDLIAEIRRLRAVLQAIATPPWAADPISAAIDALEVEV
jgi:hypothetical protein